MKADESAKTENATVTFEVTCHTCQSTFDALQCAWCSCLASERTLVCPHCLHCFCAAPAAYKRTFWSGAPRELWDLKFAEHHARTEVPSNVEPAAVVRPLVLVVDDEEDIRRIAALAIGCLGYGLLVGTNGEEGLDLARRYLPDLVLVDALMPKLDGREMCRRLKADPTTAHIKTIVMTALYTNVKYRNEAFKKYKVDDYLSKPIEFTSLRALLQKYLT